MSGHEHTVQQELLRLSKLAVEMGERHAGAIGRLAELYARVLGDGGTLYFAGNGGSAADAQHIATEYVVRYRNDRHALSAVALTTDTSLLTAAGNDLGFEEVFARQVEALCTPRDLLVLHSTSGASPNLMRAAEVAKQLGVVSVALLGGDGGKLRDIVDHHLTVPSDDASHIQEMHLAVEHVICGLVENWLAE